MAPPIWIRGRVFGGPEGVPLGLLFEPFFWSTFDFYETLKRYENRHLSVSEPSEDAFFGSFPKLDFRSKKAPRCFVYRHFSDFRSLRKDVFWNEKGVILSRFRGTRKVAKMLIYKASGRFLRFHFYCFFVVFAFPRFILKHYVYNCFSDFWPSEKGGSGFAWGSFLGYFWGLNGGTKQAQNAYMYVKSTLWSVSLDAKDQGVNQGTSSFWKRGLFWDALFAICDSWLEASLAPRARAAFGPCFLWFQALVLH